MGHAAQGDHAEQLACAAGDLLGRAIALQVPADKPQQAPQKHEFAFDKVFAPAAGQVSPSSSQSACPHLAARHHQLAGQLQVVVLSQHISQCMLTQLPKPICLSTSGSKAPLASRPFSSGGALSAYQSVHADTYLHCAHLMPFG